MSVNEVLSPQIAALSPLERAHYFVGRSITEVDLDFEKTSPKAAISLYLASAQCENVLSSPDVTPEIERGVSMILLISLIGLWEYYKDGSPDSSLSSSVVLAQLWATSRKLRDLLPSVGEKLQEEILRHLDNTEDELAVAIARDAIAQGKSATT